MLKVAGKAAWAWLKSPQAKRYEIAIAIGLYQAVMEAIKHG